MTMNIENRKNVLSLFEKLIVYGFIYLLVAVMIIVKVKKSVVCDVSGTRVFDVVNTVFVKDVRGNI